MTEPVEGDPQTPDQDGATGDDDATSRLDAALQAFKPRDQVADSSLVSESGRSGMTWSPVTDTGAGSGTETDPRPRSSFRFDLGSALARLGGAEPPPADESVTPDVVAKDDPAASMPVREREPAVDEPVESLPVRGRGPVVEKPGEPVDEPMVEPLPVRGREPVPEQVVDEPVEPLPVRSREPRPPGGAPADSPPVAERLPTRTPKSEAPVARSDEPAPPAPVQPPSERPAARVQPSKSVFDSGNPSPTLPATAGAAASAPRSPFVPSSSPVPAPGDPLVPSLPASAPAAPPSVIAPIESAPSTPQINALRSAQLRANRNDRRGKLFGRSMLALVVLGGLVAAALLFGRSYLFPTEWDPELTPLVDDIQSARNAEFDHTVSLVERPASEYAPLVTAHVLGTEWNTRLPEWRALGIAAGDGSVADVQVRIAALYPAFFDPESDSIVVAADRSVEAREPALRLALETLLATQLGDEDEAEMVSALGLTGLESMDATARRAYDAAAAGLVSAAPDAVVDLAGVPLPVAYQLRAVDSIGAALVEGASEPRPGDPLPPAANRLADEPVQAVGGLRQPGDQQVLEPVALGADDWALVWASRLPPSVVGQMVDSLAADSYSVVSRSGVTCSIAVFQTDTAEAGTSLLANLTSWATRAAPGTGAIATQLGPDRVQVEACDPGASAAISPSISATDLVISRQLDRLAR